MWATALIDEIIIILSLVERCYLEQESTKIPTTANVSLKVKRHIALSQVKRHIALSRLGALMLSSHLRVNAAIYGSTPGSIPDS